MLSKMTSDPKNLLAHCWADNPEGCEKWEEKDKCSFQQRVTKQFQQLEYKRRKKFTWEMRELD